MDKKEIALKEDSIFVLKQKIKKSNITIDSLYIELVNFDNTNNNIKTKIVYLKGQTNAQIKNVDSLSDGAINGFFTNRYPSLY